MAVKPYGVYRISKADRSYGLSISDKGLSLHAGHVGEYFPLLDSPKKYVGELLAN